MATARHIDLPAEPPFVTAAERRQLLVEWNNTEREYPRNRCVHHLFETQVQKTPDAMAVVFEHQQLTYRELNSRANRVAHHLQSLGVRPDVLVGLCVERAPEMFVGMLGVLKALGAYVPLDPNYPDERLGTIISEAQPYVLLTNRHISSRFRDYTGPAVFLNSESSFGVEEESENLAIEITPESLAYVIFTSGSTGKPKGVLISHRSLVNHSSAIARSYDLRPCDRVLQFASCSFDVAAEEIFPTLLSGATVVLGRKGAGMPSLRSFFEFVEQQEITVLNLPAAYWHEWVSVLDEVGVPPKVRLVVVGSEKVSAERFFVWKKRIGRSVRLLNAYGPTEATITATLYEPSDELQGSPNDCMPIGQPIDNTQAYVLDPNLNPVPIGMPGELYIGGDCLARGYLNQPELTAERFIAHPFSTETGARIYKTGDLARYSPDGNLEYLGRVDDQVKLRGFRIELGEVEAAINQYAGVRDAAVITREDTPGDKRLVAYVIHARGASCMAGELRSYLRQKLPEYMVPSAFVAVDSFPLTASGKVDRRALPPPDFKPTNTEEGFVAPRDNVERQLATLWAKLLGAPSVGIHDNFFELGGNSLLALRLVSQIEKNFGANLTVAVLYEAPTIAQLVAVISQEARAGSCSSLVSLQPGGSKPPFFWIHGETSDAFLPRYLGPDQPVYGFRHQSEDGQPACYTIVEEIARHHLSEIRTAQAHGPYFLGGYCFGGLVAFEIAQQLNRQAEEVRLLALLAPDVPGNYHSASVATAVSTKTLLGEKLLRYVRTLKALEPRQKLVYAIAGISTKIKESVWFPILEMVQRTACKFCVALGYRLPIGLRSRYILDVYANAVSGYVPDIYPGRIIIFKPTEDSISVEIWRTLAGHGLEVHEVPGQHGEVVNKETHVRIWAEQLKHYLNDAIPLSKHDTVDVLSSAPPVKYSRREPLNA